MGISIVRELENRRATTNDFTAPVSDYLLRKRNQSRPRDRNGFISPSGVGGCPQWALNQLRAENSENTMDPWMDPFFAVANDIHTIYQQLGVEAGVLDPNSIEKWVDYPKWYIGGSIDGQFINNGPLFEIKSVNSFYFKRVCDTNTILPHHAKQNHVYMLALGKRESRFLYVSRETPNDIKEVKYKWDWAVYHEIKNWIEPIIKAYEKGGDFPKHFDWFDCQGCPYFSANSKKFRILNGKEQIA